MEVAAVRLDIPCFSPSKALFSTFASVKGLATVDDWERSARANRLVVCFSSAVLRLQEPVDSARRPFLQIDAERNKVEDAEEACEGSSNRNIENEEHFPNSWPCNSLRDHEDDGNGVPCQCRSFNGALSSPSNANVSSMIDERERLRRVRIGLANKGKIPWNKGKCHSPETIARMKEYSKAAMQIPQIREKLRQYSHPQSEETREKIRKFMKARMDFERGQLTILQEWRDYIASMARNGMVGDDVLQWDSYQVLKKELQRQYFAAKKENQKDRKPKVLQYEHKLRISESIKAKWADSEYRTRIVTRIREAKPKRQRVSNGKLIDPEFDLILDSQTSVSNVLFNDSVLSHDVKVGSYNDSSSKEKLKKIKLLRLQNATRKETQSELETIGSELVDLNIETRTDLMQKKNEKETNVSVQDTIYNVSSSRGVDITSLHQARYEATERARILLAEAEQAAICAAQALDAAGSYDERLSISLLETWTLLDEASKYISASKVNRYADKLI